MTTPSFKSVVPFNSKELLFFSQPRNIDKKRATRILTKVIFFKISETYLI